MMLVTISSFLGRVFSLEIRNQILESKAPILRIEFYILTGNFYKVI